MGGEPEELTLEHWQRAIDVNLGGVLHGCHAAYPIMKRQAWGHIVNTASLTGLGPGLGTTGPYNTTKYAIVVSPRQARIAWLALRLSPRLGDALGTRMTRLWREHAASVQAATRSSAE